MPAQYVRPFVKTNKHDAADAEEDKTEKLEEAGKAVRDFSDTATRGAASIQQAISGLPGGEDPRYRPTAKGESSSDRARAAFEASAFRVGDTPINYGGNPDAKPTHSTGFLTNPASDLASRVSESANWSSVAPQGLAKVQSSAESLSSHAAAAKNRGAVTIKVVGENGSIEGQVEGDEGIGDHPEQRVSNAKGEETTGRPESAGDRLQADDREEGKDHAEPEEHLDYHGEKLSVDWRLPRERPFEDGANDHHHELDPDGGDRQEDQSREDLRERVDDTSD
jgi:hypothetical protein